MMRVCVRGASRSWYRGTAWMKTCHRTSVRVKCVAHIVSDMSGTREFPAEDSESRMRRAEQCTVLDVREIGADGFDVSDETTVYEVDVVNEDGQLRENVTIIPRILFESTKDVQYRHEYGIVGKYSLALAQENEQAKEELRAGIEEKRSSVQGQIDRLKQKQARLLHTECDLGLR